MRPVYPWDRVHFCGGDCCLAPLLPATPFFCVAKTHREAGLSEIGFSGLKSFKKGTFAETKEFTAARIDVDSNFCLSKFVDKKSGGRSAPAFWIQNGLMGQ